MPYHSDGIDTEAVVEKPRDPRQDRRLSAHGRFRRDFVKRLMASVSNRDRQSMIHLHRKKVRIDSCPKTIGLIAKSVRTEVFTDAG